MTTYELGQSHTPDIPDAEFENAARQLELIPKAMTKKQHVPVVWDTGKGWFWSHKQGGSDGTITADKNDYYKYGYRYCEGVITHEPSHAVISKDLVEQFTPEEWNQPGFAVGVNWFEDNRIEYAADDLIAGGRGKIKQHLDIDVQPGHGLDFALDTRDSASLGGSMDMMGKVRDKLSYIPMHMRFGAVARNYFYEKDIAKTLQTPQDLDAFVDRVRTVDQKVADAFVKLRPDIERYYNTVPGRFPPKKLIKQKAQETAAIYKNYLWPEYQKMVDESYENHSLSKFIEDLAGGAQFQGQDPNGQVTVVNFDDLPPEVQDEIRKKIEEQQGQKGQQPQEGGQPQAGGGMSQGGGESGKGESQQGEGGEGGGAAGEQKQEEGKKGEGKEGEGKGEQAGGQSASDGSGSAQSEKDGKATGEGGKAEGEKEAKEGEEAGAGAGTSPFDKLSDKAKEEVKKAWDQVGEEDKKEVTSKAAKEMGEAEDEINKQLQGHSDAPGVNRPTEAGKTAQKKYADKATESAKSQSGKGKGEGKEGGKEERKSGDGEQAEETDSSQGNGGTGQSHTEARVPTEDDLKALRDYMDAQAAEKPPETVYDATLEKDYIKKAIQHLNSEVTFDPNAEPTVLYSDHGGELDLERDMGYDMAGESRTDTQKVESREEKVENRFIILGDISGSMDGLREQLLDFMVIQTEYLTYQGIDNATCVYTDSGPGFTRGVVKVLKDYSRDLPIFGSQVPKEVKKEIGKILNPSFGGGGTPTSTAMRAAYEHVLLPRHREFQMSVKSRNFFILLTDGQPTDSLGAFTPAETAILTQKLLYEQAKKENMPLTILSLGIGPGTEFVSNISVALPPDLQAQVAQKLSEFRQERVDPQSVTTSFPTIQELVHVWPLFIEYMLKYPEEFENFDRNK